MPEQRRPMADEIIAQVGCTDAVSIEECLLAACDTELDKPEGEPQDIQRAFNCVRAVILRCDGNTAPEAQRYLAGALFRRAQFLAQLGHPDEARSDFKDVANSWRDSTDPRVRRVVAANWLEAGQFEEEQGNKRTALQCYTHAMAHADDPDDMTQLQVVRAQSNRGEIHAALGELDEAENVFDAAIQRWEAHSDYWIRRAVANMRVYKAAALKNERYYEGAIPLFEEAILYADRAIDPPAYFIQSGAWASKAGCLQVLERYEEAIACVDAMENWIVNHVRPTSSGRSAHSMAEKSLRGAYFTKSRCLYELERFEEALRVFDLVGVTYDDIAEDMDKRADACHKLVLRARILADLGRCDEAMKAHDEIVHRTMSFGQPAWTPEMLVSIAFLLSHIKECSGEALTTPADGLPDPS